MNYVCVLLSKETVDKQVFYTKQEALECFEEKFGQDIRTEANKKLNSLKNRLARQQAEYTGTEEQDEKLDKTNSEIAAQRKLLENSLTNFSERIDPWKPHIVFNETNEILHIGSIYCRPGRYDVVEDKHYVRFEEIEYEGDAKDLCRELYFQHRDKGHTIYILNGADASDRAVKKVVKLRNQLARDYKKEAARL